MWEISVLISSTHCICSLQSQDHSYVVSRLTVDVRCQCEGLRQILSQFYCFPAHQHQPTMGHFWSLLSVFTQPSPTTIYCRLEHTETKAEKCLSIHRTISRGLLFEQDRNILPSLETRYFWPLRWFPYWRFVSNCWLFECLFYFLPIDRVHFVKPKKVPRGQYFISRWLFSVFASGWAAGRPGWEVRSNQFSSNCLSHDTGILIGAAPELQTNLREVWSFTITERPLLDY